MPRSFIVPRGLILKKSEKWIPKKWKPIYEEMVLFSASGKSNEDIAKLSGYTIQQVSNILNTPQAKEILRGISKRARDGFVENFYEKIERISEQAIVNIEKVLFNETYLENAPIAMFDRSLSFMKAAGKLNGDSPHQSQTTNIVIGADVQRTLIEGLQKANKVMELHDKNGNSRGVLSQLSPPKES